MAMTPKQNLNFTNVEENYEYARHRQQGGYTTKSLV